MLFCDLEFYVPKEDRNNSSSSLIVNPNFKKHKLLGGTFYSKSFDDNIPKNPIFKQLWLWNFENNEKILLEQIYKIFIDEWEKTKKENKRILGKPLVDLVVCGIGISRFDIPALYCRSFRFLIDRPDKLFDIYFKTKQIDLANVCSFLFPEEQHIYPKTSKEIMGRMKIKGEKDTSKNVWELFDKNDVDKIETRTTEEVKIILNIYQKSQEQIVRKNY